MSKWLTIEEILNSPIEPSRHDPFYHSQKFPKFMKRKVILSENYEKKITKSIIQQKESHRRTVSEQSPTQRSFQPYGRVAEKVKSIFEKNSNKPILPYDEAQENQKAFSFASPNTQSIPSDFKISYFPRETTADSKFLKTKSRKNNSQPKIPHKLPPKPSTALTSLTKPNILVILSRHSPRKCLNCNKIKCECEIADPEIPKNLYDNIQKGKNLIEQVKADKKVQKPKTQVPKPRSPNKHQKSLVFEKLLDTLWKIPVKDKNTVEGTQIILNKRRQSSEYKKNHLSLL